VILRRSWLSSKLLQSYSEAALGDNIKSSLGSLSFSSHSVYCMLPIAAHLSIQSLLTVSEQEIQCLHIVIAKGLCAVILCITLRRMLKSQNRVSSTSKSFIMKQIFTFKWQSTLVLLLFSCYTFGQSFQNTFQLVRDDNYMAE
jgi:hypothetical protein